MIVIVQNDILKNNIVWLELLEFYDELCLRKTVLVGFHSKNVRMHKKATTERAISYFLTYLNEKSLKSYRISQINK